MSKVIHTNLCFLNRRLKLFAPKCACLKIRLKVPTIILMGGFYGILPLATQLIENIYYVGTEFTHT